MSDTISCGCGNKFNVFETSHQWRPMSCIKCRRGWWITCSGRRLKGMRSEEEQIEMLKSFARKLLAAQKSTDPNFEKAFRENYKDLFA